jgi:cytochrome c-type biogenesis protein CcmE
MKPGHILGVAVIVGCMVVAGFALRGSVRQSLTVKEVMASDGEPCGLYGEVVKGSDRYDVRSARLEFQIKDTNGDMIPVVYSKSKPANFSQASHVKAMGAYRDGAFHADELVLKCPSKYIGQPPAPTKAAPSKAGIDWGFFRRTVSAGGSDKGA